MAEAPSADLTALSTAILLALADAPRHGYGILKEIERQSSGRTRPRTGSVYAALQRLSSEGLIADAPDDDSPSGDARRVYYRITTTGLAAVRAEARRMAEWLRLAEEKRVVSWLELLPTPAES